jgi:hypothetical protein
LDRKALVYIRGTIDIIRAAEIVRAAEIIRAAEIARVSVIKVFIFIAI